MRKTEKLTQSHDREAGGNITKKQRLTRKRDANKKSSRKKKVRGQNKKPDHDADTASHALKKSDVGDETRDDHAGTTRTNRLSRSNKKQDDAQGMRVSFAGDTISKVDPHDDKCLPHPSDSDDIVALDPFSDVSSSGNSSIRQRRKFVDLMETLYGLFDHLLGTSSSASSCSSARSSSCSSSSSFLSSTKKSQPIENMDFVISNSSHRGKAFRKKVRFQ